MEANLAAKRRWRLWLVVLVCFLLGMLLGGLLLAAGWLNPGSDLNL